MTGKERALAALDHRPTDHVSIFPSVDVAASAKYIDKPVGQCFVDPVLHARSLEALLDRHPGIDGVYINLCLTGRTARKVGPDRYSDGTLQWRVPENDIGTVAVRTIEDPEDPLLLEANPLQDGILDTYRAVEASYKDRFLILPGITGPYSHLTFLYGLENTMMLMLDDPDLMHRLLRRRTELAIAWGTELARCGAEAVWIGEGAASGSLLPLRLYQEFVQPYAAAVVDAMRGLGVRTLMHVCGDINATAAAVAATGADGIDVDHMVPTSFVASQAKRPVCIKGNLDPVALLRSTPQQVQHLCRQIIATAPEHFILGTGCLVARDTPPENIDAMLAAIQYNQEVTQ